MKLDPGDFTARVNRSAVHEMLDDLPRALADLKVLSRRGRLPEPLAERLASLEAEVGASLPAWSVSEQMWREFVVMTPSQTVAELVEAVVGQQAFFVVLSHDGRHPAMASTYGRNGLRHHLTSIAEDIGASILALRLEQLPDPFRACEPVALDTELEAAVRCCHRSGGHTVVLDEGRIVGVMAPRYDRQASSSKTILFSSPPSFEREDSPDRPRRCTSCDATPQCFEPVIRDGRLEDYACPACGVSPIPSWIELRMRPGAWSRAGFLGGEESLARTIADDQATLERLGSSCQRVGAALQRLLDAAEEGYAERITEAATRLEDTMRERGQRGFEGEAILPLVPSLDDVERILNARALPAPDEGVMVGDHQIFLRVFLGYQHCPWTTLVRPWSDQRPPLPIVTRRVGKVVHETAVNGVAQRCRADLEYRHADREFIILNRVTGQHLRGSGLMAHLIGDHGFFQGRSSRYRIEPEHAIAVLGSG